MHRDNRSAYPCHEALLCISSCALALTLGACSATHDDDALTGMPHELFCSDVSQVPGDLSQEPSGVDAARNVPESQGGATIGALRANGTACPAGTWVQDTSADGLRLQLRMQSFYVDVYETQDIDVKNCQLQIPVTARTGYTCTLSTLEQSSYAYLEPGVELQMVRNAYIDQMPVRPESTPAPYIGPFDDRYLFRETFREDDMVWSSCGGDMLVHLNMMLLLRNSQPRASGYVSVCSPTLFSAQLVCRPCSDEGDRSSSG